MTAKNYYPEVFLEECKYIIKERKIHKYIIDDVEISSDSDEEIIEKTQMEKHSNEENSDEEDSSKEKKNIFYIYKKW